jgi:6-phosphogluconate dehydrogenase
MRFGVIGLGRMGLSLGQLAVEQGHEPVGWDPSEEARKSAEGLGLETADRLEDVPAALPTPRVLILWVPHGDPVDQNLQALLPVLEADDVVADCGNSHWEASRRRHDELAAHGLRFLDVGTSGGISDAPGWQGAAFMAGGPRDGFDLVRPLLADLAVDDAGVLYAGPSPAGHFVKLVHNAIEFGMIQAIAEGVELLRGFDHDLDLPAIFEHWNHGTVIRSWLIELMGYGLAHGGIGPESEVPGDLEQLSTHVEDTGEVKWVLDWATGRDIPTPVTSEAQQMLMAYRDAGWPAAKAVALLRNQFGGHPIHRADDDTHG